jgi:hypothetical protein
MIAGRTGGRILVSGMMAGTPGQGGATWAVLQYVLGLRRLGHDVWFVEPIAGQDVPAPGRPLEASERAAYFRSVVEAFGIAETSTMLDPRSRLTVGVPYQRLLEVARSSDVVIDMSGMLSGHELLESAPVRVYVDLDPAFNQLWAEDGIDRGFGGHTHFASVGLRLGALDCPVPTHGLEWMPTLPPIVLNHWPVAGPVLHDAFTTVGNWRSYGSIGRGSVQFGQRAHSMRELMELPFRSGERFLLALDIHPDDTHDLKALHRNGWTLTDPATAAGTPHAYREFVAGSFAELGVAKSGYVRSRCGWISDRSACYLASGRPVVAQATGFEKVLPTGQGLLAFTGLEDAVEAVRAVRTHSRRHRKAARALAEEHFDSDRVLASLLDRVSVAPVSSAARAEAAP